MVLFKPVADAPYGLHKIEDENGLVVIYTMVPNQIS